MTQQTVRGALPTAIVADDLTGATDSAVQFARDGWAARLALTVPSAGSATPGAVVAVVTDARALPDAEARSTTAAAVTSLLAAGNQRLFVKIDSTMRGSILAQVEGALDSWSVEHPGAAAIICSAYPAMGRTIEDGHILVDGADVHETAIGTDPVTPVTTSDLRVLLPGSTHVTSPTVTSLLAAINDGAHIITVDASSDTDLAQLADAIGQLGERAIPVGAAGLAVAMSRVWSAPVVSPRAAARAGRIVVVVSSLHDVSRTQADYLREHFSPSHTCMLAPTLADALHPEGMPAWAAAQLAGHDPLPELIIIASPSERPAEVPAGAEGAPATAAELIADSLATITDLVLAAGPVDALMLLGGEGARAVLSRLGTESLLVRDAIREGIPLGVLEGGTADGLTVITKAGGFGTPSTVHEIVTELLNFDTPNREGNAS